MKVFELKNTIPHPKLCWAVLPPRKQRLPAGAPAAVFGPHRPVGSVGVSDSGTDKPEFGEYARPWNGGARLLCAITNCRFMNRIAHVVIKLSLSGCLRDNLKPEIDPCCDRDSTSAYMKTLRTENEFPALWDPCAPPVTAGEPRLCRRAAPVQQEKTHK